MQTTSTGTPSISEEGGRSASASMSVALAGLFVAIGIIAGVIMAEKACANRYERTERHLKHIELLLRDAGCGTPVVFHDPLRVEMRR